MPNWCSNDITVSGSREDLKEFEKWFNEEFYKEGDLNYEAVTPYPIVYWIKDNIKSDIYKSDGYNSGGHDWCNNNWGTKWEGVGCSGLIVRKRSMIFSFDTAWSPSIPITNKLSQGFPNLKFTHKFYECCAGYKGKYTAKGGLCLENEEDNYRGDRGG